MNDKLNSAFMDDPEFQSLMVDCLEALQSGKSIDRDALRKKFPKYADDLDQYLDVLHVLDQFAGGLSQINSSGDLSSAYEATITPHTSQHKLDSTETIRYIGEYEVLEEIARGGMGVVFKARQASLKRIVALKMILSGRLADTAEIDRFRREAQAASRLQHSNIVPVHEIGEHNGRQYFTMDYVDGHSLADEIREESLAPKRAATLVKTIAEAVQFAHGKETLHRDLKPANILLTDDEEPHVTDFGLAKILDEVDDASRADLTASGQILGTPSYMSPEQAEGKQDLVGPATDIYSLGAILYACLTGRAPFVADSPVDTLMQVIHKEPVSPRQLNPTVPQDLETICLKCLNKEPHKRYGTAQELADDLQRYLEDRPVLARPVGSIERGWRWSKRNPIIASLTALSCLLLIAGTTVSIILAVAEHSQRLIAEKAESEAIAASKEAEAERDAAKLARNIAEQRGEELRRQLYVAHMNQAMTAWDNDNVRRVRQLLAFHVPNEGTTDNRGFEWYYLDRLVNSHVLEISFDEKVHAIDCSPDGRLVAVGGPERVEVFDLLNGESVAELEVRLGYTGDLAFSPDGSLLVTGGFNNQIQSWDTVTWHLRHSTRVTDGPRELIFHPDGRTVLYRHHNREGVSGVRRFDVLDGRELLAIEPPHLVSHIALHPDGREIATTDKSNTVRFYDARSGRLLRSWEGPNLTSALVYSPDGDRIALAANARGTQVRNGSSGDVLQEWETSGILRSLAFHPDGRHLLGGGSATTANMLDTRTGDYIRDFRGHDTQIVNVAFRPGMRQIVTADQDGRIKVWDRFLESATSLSVDAYRSPMSAFDPSGRWLAVAQGVPWERERPGFVEVFDSKTHELHMRLEGHDAGVFGVAFDSDGSRLASADGNGRIIIWKVEDGTPVKIIETERTLLDIAFWPDDSKLVTGGERGVSTWDPLTGEELGTYAVGDNNMVHSVTVASDGNAFAGCANKAFVLWDADGNKIMDGPYIAGNNVSDGITFAPDGQTFVAANNRMIDLYDVQSGRRKASVPAHSERIVALEFLPGGRRLVSKTHLGAVKLWDLQTLQSLMTLTSVDPNGWNEQRLAVDPAGERIVAGHSLARLVMHDIRPGVRDSIADPEYWAVLARAQAGRRQWELAQQNFDRAVESSEDLKVWNEAIACALIAGDDDRYRTLIAEAFERLPDVESDAAAMRGGQLARLACLRDEVTDLDMLRQLAERSWNENRPGPALLHVLYRMREYEEILERTEVLLKSGGKDRTCAFLFRAIALYRLGRIPEGNDTLTFGMRLVERDYTRPNTRQLPYPINEYAAFEFLRKETDTIALEALDKVIGETSNDATLYAVRGDLHRRWRRWDQATADFRRAVDLQPDSMDNLKAATATAILAEDVGDRQKEDCLAILKLLQDPKWINNAWSAGRIVALTPRPLDDEKLLRVVRVLANKNIWWNRIALVAVLHRMGRTEEALQFMASVQPTKKDWREHALTLLWRSVLLASLGQKEDAQTAFDEAELLIEENLLPPGVTTTVGEVLILRQEAFNLLAGAQNDDRRVEEENASVFDETDELSDRDQVKELNQPLEDSPKEPPINTDMSNVQMEPAPIVKPPNNSRNPLVTSPDDPQVDPKQIQAWIKQLDSKSESERSSALHSLQKAGEEAYPAFQRLMKFLDEEDSYEKGLAIDRLGAIGPNAAEAVPQLHKILKDSETFYLFRFKAANTMSQMGNAGEVAIPTLIEIVKDPGPSQKQRLKTKAAPSALGLMAPLIRKDEKGDTSIGVIRF